MSDISQTGGLFDMVVPEASFRGPAPFVRWASASTDAVVSGTLVDLRPGSYSTVAEIDVLSTHEITEPAGMSQGDRVAVGLGPRELAQTLTREDLDHKVEIKFLGAVPTKSGRVRYRFTVAVDGVKRPAMPPREIKALNTEPLSAFPAALSNLTDDLPF